MAGSGSERFSVCLAGDPDKKMILQRLLLNFILYCYALCLNVSFPHCRVSSASGADKFTM